MLRYAEDAGWQSEVLCVDARDVDMPSDPWLEETLPAHVAIHRVRASASRLPVNTLAFRARASLAAKGDELLASGRFDLVFFSTTEFLVHLLGVRWQREFRVPFCMDFQDPWVNEYYRQNPQVIPPGGRLKYALMDRINRWAEQRVVRACDGFLAVSHSYLTDLATRYGVAVQRRPSLVLPFPADPSELALTAPETVNRGVWCYVGRGGPDMRLAASAFFFAWARSRRTQPDSGAQRFEALGTSYAADGQGEKSIEPLADAHGLADVCRESPDRLGYLAMLATIRSSAALVVFGSDDPSYTASKIYPYLLSRRPLLAIFHEQSSVVDLIKSVGGGVCVTFSSRDNIETLGNKIFERWFANRSWCESVALDSKNFEPFTAKAQAQQLKAWFDRVIEASCEKRQTSRVAEQ